MPYLPKPKNKGKRTSLMPVWMNKKGKSNKSEEPLKLENNIPEVNEEKSENLNRKYPNYNNEDINNSQAYEKVTYKNTTTRSVERVTPDGEYNKAVETNEQVEERIKYGNTKGTFEYDRVDIIGRKNALDIDPIEEKEVTQLEIIEPSSKKLLTDNLNSYSYGSSLKLVKQDGMLLKNIENQTRELCLEAVKQNGLAIQFAQHQNEMIYLSAVSQNGLSLKYIRNQTPTVCLKAVKQNHLAFAYVKNKTEDVCNEVVKVNGLALELIKIQTPQMCINAINQNPFALEFVIDQTPMICEEAIYRSGLTLEFVRDKTPDLCLLALQQSAQAIRYIPSSILSQSLDLSNYVFVCVGSRSIVPSIPEIRGLKRISLSPNDTGYNIMNALLYNDTPTNFVVQKEGYVDDNFVEDLKFHNHFVVVVGHKRTL